MYRHLSFFSLIILLTSTIPLQATIIQVPGDQPTIQAGIDACIDGDTVLVADGTYTGDGNRDIDFDGRAIVLISENGPDVTIIDIKSSESDLHRGFWFHSGEDLDSVVQGFTITNGYYSYGAGVKNWASGPLIRNCTFIGNSAYLDGGGMHNDNFSYPTIINCTFTGNSADKGGGMYNTLSFTTVTNCMFSGNSALYYGGGMCNNSFFPTSPTVTNCIFWSDFPDEIFGGDPIVTYSDVQGGYPGVGNIDADPLFFTFGRFDYFLDTGSPCIDEGIPLTSADEPTADGISDWHPRWPKWIPNGPHTDMGAYGGPGNVGWLP